MAINPQEEGNIMEGLGREFNVVPIAAGVAISLKRAQAVTFICTGNDTFTLTVADTFAGSYATPGNIVTRKVTNTATNGTAVWAEATQAASNAVTISSGTVSIHVSGDSLPDGKAYVKCTQSSAGLVTAIVHDLTTQRTPANLPALSA
jgi:sarcosine oxidase gamma subunit